MERVSGVFTAATHEATGTPGPQSAIVTTQGAAGLRSGPHDRRAPRPEAGRDAGDHEPAALRGSTLQTRTELTASLSSVNLYGLTMAEQNPYSLGLAMTGSFE